LRHFVPQALVLSAALAVLAAVGFVGCGLRAPEVDGLPEVVDFNLHVRPILSDRCFACHGPDAPARQAGLRLDRREGAFAELPSGHRAVVPGRAGRSALVERILSDDPSWKMPPPESRLVLEEREKALLVRWIEEGAEWKPHWAFIPPTKPAVPDDGDRGRNEIDAFVLATLQEKGLSPSPEASRETLLRRLSLDLTGLPPTLEEIDAFVADDSPSAYEDVVDILLASPAFGERMASEWLDVARYADSHGYQDDGMRQMWPWRDWVIDAFNDNLPFDEFVTWQLAGDLLPEPTQEQLLATGFCRNHMQSQEGGIVPEEYRTEYVADRVDTLGRAFLGVTVECARCHDHKYDPVSQEEYYQLFAFFNNVNETGQIPYSGVPSPAVIVTDEEAEATLSSLRTRIAELEAQLDAALPAFDAGFHEWLNGSAPPVSEPGGLVVHLPLDVGERVLEPLGEEDEPDRERRYTLRFANPADPSHPAYLGGDLDRLPESLPGPVGMARRLAGDSHIGLDDDVDGVAFFERNEPFSLALWLRIEAGGMAGPLVTRSAGLFGGNRGYEVILHEDGRLTAGLHHVFPDGSIEIETRDPIAPGEWRHLTFTYDGSSRARGLRLFLDGEPLETKTVVDNLRRSIIYDQEGANWDGNAGLRLGRRHDQTLEDVSVDDLRVYDRQLTGCEAARLGGGSSTLQALWSTEAARRSEAQWQALREHYVLRVAPGLEEKRRTLTGLRGEENALLTSLPEVMTLRERSRPRETFVLARGAYDAPTSRVEPGTPAIMGALPSDRPRNRLGLARWLLDPAHPLTARVLVNRYWALLFGRGLVATPADFGSQGRLPTHPELLDWLAVTFVESGWDLKGLLKRMVLSSTYRQSSVVDARLRETDPENEWLARGPSHRLAAEQIRDEALAASGLLVRQIGGPSVYPYQPPGLWKELATRNATEYEQGHGDDLHRRSLYTVWKRSSPPPAAIAFDAADRLSCTVKRQRTSTPLQALVLLNDPQFVEASRVLGERMIRQGGTTPEERITLGFRLLTSRAPGPGEIAVLGGLLEAERAVFEEDPRAARALLGVGERPPDPEIAPPEAAAYAVVASTVMSFDEVVYKR
jgi:hypothetical protein